MNTVFQIVPSQKLCSKCKVSKDCSEFYKHVRGSMGLTGRCKKCVREDQKEASKNHTLNPELQRKRYKKWREGLKADPERYENYKKKKTEFNKSDKYYDSYFKRKFGISLNDFSSMLQRQNGLCSNIGCSKQIALRPAENEIKAVVDHCHQSGKVRSLMCVRCNSLLGHIENNSSLIPGLMDYLNKHRN